MTNMTYAHTVQQAIRMLGKSCVRFWMKKTTDSFGGQCSEEVRFPNGCGASIIWHKGAYGLELAVLNGDKISYSTHITSDVIGWIGDERELYGYLLDISRLPMYEEEPKRPFEYSYTANRNPETGIRYGVTNRIPGWFFAEMMDWDCPDYDEARKEIAEEVLRSQIEKQQVDPEELAEFADLAMVNNELTEEDFDDILEAMSAEQLLDFVESNFDYELSVELQDIDDSEWSKFGSYRNEQGEFKMMLSYLGGSTLAVGV